MRKSIFTGFARKAVLATTLAFASFVPLAAETALLPSGERLELAIRAGSEWSHVKKFGVAKVTLMPQFAVWLEREDGGYAGELLVTKKSAKSAWGKIRRPDALPVWSHARGVRAPDGLFMPTKAEPLSDAVSGATPKAKGRGSEFRFVLRLPQDLEGGSYRILVELNNSFDYNDTYAEQLPADDPHSNGVNGQPAVVYAARLDLGGAVAGVVPEDTATPLEFIGTGHPTGIDGTIRPGRDGLTSALEIIESIQVRAVRGNSD